MPASILALPAELIEHILILAALSGDPTAIAALARAAPPFAALVYHSPDHHLWREVFLVTFDPPRSDPYDWGAQYRARVSAAALFKPLDSPASSRTSLADTDDDVDRYTRALDALVDVAHTALPYPPTICPVSAPALVFAAANLVPGSVPQPAFPSYPIFPPPSTAAASSRNVQWLDAVLSNGLPPPLARRLSGSTWHGGILGDALDDSEARLMQALAKFVACTGFRPAPRAGSSCCSSESEQSSGSESEDEEPVKEQDTPSITPARLASETFIAGASVVAGFSLDTSAAAQARRARRLARMRAYNLRFLEPARAWGPFLRADPPARPPVESPESVGVRACEVESDDEETDWEPLPPPTLLEKAAWTRTRLPPPAALAPDWTYLAAARVVVEANLREAVGAAQLAGLTALDGLRAGSAPLEIGACAVQGGWDWAGVTGVWRRVICWLDYRDLISHNLSSDYNDPKLTEAVRIVPMRLRAAGFRPPANPRFPDRPTILVEGETAANATTGTVRHLEGTVTVARDGSVCWRIVLMGQNPGDPTEWVSEGVQVGGPGSAMGVLGLWTGSLHERVDPLGPCWAWKVG